jgi:hypothetical protein
VLHAVVSVIQVKKINQRAGDDNGNEFPVPVLADGAQEDLKAEIVLCFLGHFMTVYKFL